MNQTKRNRLRLFLIIFGALFTLYTLIGFFVLPGFIKPRILSSVETMTGRKISLGEMSINPFALSVDAQHLIMYDKENDKFIGAKEIYINFEIVSLFNHSLTFSEIKIDSPFIFTKIFKDSSTSFTHIIPDSPPAKETSEPRTLVINKLSINNGSTIYEDRTKRNPFVIRFDSLNFSLNDFTTRPKENGLYSFEAKMQQGEYLAWKGTITTTPTRSTGSFLLSGIKANRIWEFMQDRFYFEITDGIVEIDGTYDFFLQNEKPQFLIHQTNITGKSINIIDKQTKKEAVKASTAQLSGMELDYLAQKVSIASITGDSALIYTLRLPDGGYSVKSLLKPIPDNIPSPPWDFKTDKIELKNMTCFLTDQTVSPAAELVLTPINVTMEHFHMDSDEPATLVVDAGINHSGTAHIAGTMVPLPLTTNINLELSSVGLQSFQRYIDPFAHLTIESGSLSLKGDVLYKEAGKDTLKTFAGSVSVESFRGTDQILKEDFVRLGKLELNNIDYKSKPASLKINSIVASKSYLRAIIDSSRVTNFHHIVAGNEDTTKKQDTTKKPQSRSLTQIGEIRIENSIMNFSDLSLSPNFNIGIVELNGTIKDLSSEQLTHAEVDLKGKVDRYAPAIIKGQINPLSQDLYTDILMQFQNIELTTFTPYSGKFAGYKIDKGKLSLDLHYKLNQHYLQAENKVIVDQLTLGEEVDGPDVTGLPVKLAIALLKDRHGVIDLNLPVEGDLNNPEFSVFPLIMKVLVNLITKAVMAPFTFISNLFGGGDDLSYVDFAPGSSSLNAENLTKVTNISKALTEKIELRLDIRGIACDSLDARALAKNMLIKQIRTDSTKSDFENLTEKEVGKILALFKTTFKTEPDSLIPMPQKNSKEPIDPLRHEKIVQLALQKCLSAVPITNDDLRNLAFQRATEIKNQLVNEGKIEESRIFILDAQVKATESETIVQVPLTLNAK